MLQNRLGKELLIFDGAMGTQLQNAGLSAGDIPEELNIDRPDLLRSIHKTICKREQTLLQQIHLGVTD